MNLSAELRAWRARRAERPMPVVEVDHGRTVPGPVFRVVGLVLTGVLVVTAATTVPQGSAVLTWIVTGSALVWYAVRPGRAPVTLVLAVDAVALLTSADAPFDPIVWWLAPVGYATLRLAWWNEQITARARVEWAALGRVGLRDVVVTAAALGSGALAAILTGTGSSALVAVGAAALVVLTVVLLRRWAP